MRRVLLGFGLTVVTVAAVVASFSALAGLAAFTGWGERSSWLLPASLDALGMTACLAWLDGTASSKSRRYACWLTWTAAGLSILGNGAGHLASTGHLSQGLLLVVLVGAVPPAALATTVHLIVLVSSPAEVKVVTVPDAAPVPAVKPAPSERVVPASAKTAPAKKAAPKKAVAPKPSQDEAVDEVLVHRARKLDEEHLARHGKPIPRDAARPLLGVSNEKTGEALRLAREGVAS
jgi:hypothetical protein